MQKPVTKNLGVLASPGSIFLLAVAVRLLAAFCLNYYLAEVAERTYLIEGDADGYWVLAQKLEQGEDYFLYDPPRHVIRMPGFPLVLAASIELFGDSQQAARYFLAVLTSLAVFPVYWIGQRLHSRAAGAWGALLVAITPVYVGFSVTILTECLFAAAIVTNIWACLRWIESLSPALISSDVSQPANSAGPAPIPGSTPAPVQRSAVTEQNQSNGEARILQSQSSLAQSSLIQSLGWAGLAGVLTAVAVYFRPSWLLFPICLIPVIWLSGRSAAARSISSVRSFWGGLDLKRVILGGALLVACLILSLTPWGMRNQTVTGHFVITTLWMGPSLFDGLRPGADGDSDMEFFERDRVLNRMSEYEMNQHYKNLALDFAKANPVETARLALVKFWRFWKPWPNSEQFSHPLLAVIIGVSFIALVFWAIWGSRVLWKSKEFVFLCWLPIVYFTALHLLFVSSLRYRLPVEFPLAVLAGVGIASWLANRFAPVPEQVKNQLQTQTDKSDPIPRNLNPKSNPPA